MQKKPLVSVGIPVYNREKFIQNAIYSVLNQTYQNFEIIIIDDGSTDASISIIESIKDSRIKLFKNTDNKGVVYTRNRYLKEAQGDYIAILDSDDSWLPTKLEKQIAFLENNPNYGICGSWALRKYTTGKEDIWKYPNTDDEIRARLPWGSAIVHSSMMLRRSILYKYDIEYKKGFDSVEDYDMIRQFVKYSKAYNIEEPLIVYNIHGNQITVEDNREQVLKAILVGEQYLNDLDIEFFKEERAIYKNVYKFEFCLDVGELKILKNLLERIINRIENIAKCNSDAFKKTISNKWFLSCYHSTQNGLKAITIFNSSKGELACVFSPIQKLKFYLKAILKR
ncbi:glycosyltransferase family 2 protein [Rhodohalobacter sp. 8-1]|uniref:glycosyltransferase family 2 protein n=1 Tax=Rhodohalobacter sp. 8-1 TaxID=3131972 RepID=UPI0030EC6506